MPLREIAELNLADLEQQPELKLSTGVAKSNLLVFANTYGYCYPPRDLIPDDFADDSAGEWDSWVHILAAVKGRCVLRAKFGGGTIVPPGSGERLPYNIIFAFRADRATYARHYQTWREQHKDGEHYALGAGDIFDNRTGKQTKAELRDDGDGLRYALEGDAGADAPRYSSMGAAFDALAPALTALAAEFIERNRRAAIDEA